MQKKLLAALVLLSMLFVSCSTENCSDCNTTDKQDKEIVTFEFTLPGGDEVEYDTRAIHDKSEWNLQSLWLYEFSKEGKLLKEPRNIMSEVRQGGPSYYFELMIDNEKGADPEKYIERGVRQFVFVANEPAENMTLAVGATLEELYKKQAFNELKTMSEDILYDPDDIMTSIPMTGVAKQGNTNLIAITGSSAATVDLVRIVSRIDLFNNVPNFTVSGAWFSNVNSTSNLFDTGVYPKSGELDHVGSYGEIQSGEYTEKAFYLYECAPAVADVETVPTLHISVMSTMSGEAMEYEVPFIKEGLHGNEPIPLKRNYRYIVQIGTGEPVIDPDYDVVFNISVDEWNDNTHNKVVDPIVFEVMTDPERPDITYDEDTNTLTVKEEGVVVFSITNNVGYKNHTTYDLLYAANMVDENETYNQWDILEGLNMRLEKIPEEAGMGDAYALIFNLTGKDSPSGLSRASGYGYYRIFSFGEDGEGKSQLNGGLDFGGSGEALKIVVDLGEITAE